MKNELIKIALQKNNDSYKTRNGVLKSDGIVNINEYLSLEDSKKIMWVLKEPNWDNHSDVNMIDFFKDVTTYPKWKRTYKLIFQVSYSILNGYPQYGNMPQLKDIKDVANKIALININKVGGLNKSYWKSIRDSYLRNKDILLEQVDIINPGIIINCSRVNDFFKDTLVEMNDKENTSYFRCGNTKNGIIIDSYHPNQRKITHENYYNSIILYCKKYTGV